MYLKTSFSIKKCLITLLFSFVFFLAVPHNSFAAQKPPTVKNLKCGVTTANSINISWTPQSGVSGYQVYRATAYDGKYKKIKNIAAGNYAFCNMKLKSGKEYYYKVRAYVYQGNRIVTGKYSKILTARTKGSSKSAFVRVNANVRKHAGVNHPLIAILKAGTSVTITCATTDKSGTAWSRISFTVNGRKKTGYIRTDLVTPQQKKKVTGIVSVKSRLNLRQFANPQSKVLTTLSNGTKVTILGEATGSDKQKWYQISVKKNGRTYKGYCAARYIRVL